MESEKLPLEKVKQILDRLYLSLQERAEKLSKKPTRWNLIQYNGVKSKIKFWEEKLNTAE